jgi:SAM-dependent methyltransferase
MQVTKEVMVPFLLKHMEAATGAEAEWRFSFNPGANTQQTFENCIRSLRSDSNYNEHISTETLLHVTPVETETSLIISGVPHISTYCFNESVGKMPFKVVQTLVLLSEELPDELPLSVISTVSEKRNIDASNAKVLLGDFTSSSWKTSMKQYKLSKEFKYVNKTSGITFTIIITRESEGMTMSESGVSSRDMKYEYYMNVEADKKDQPEKVQNDVQQLQYISRILEACMTMMQLLTQQSYPISKAQQLEIATEYDTIVKTVVKINKWRRDSKFKKDATDAKPFHFLAPKPITLERKHLVEPGPSSYGVVTVLKGYAVTDKADGERMLMYVNKKGEAYMINNTFDVFYTGLKTPRKELFETVLDGEFVTSQQRKDGSSKDLFAVFDIYFQEGKSLMSLPLIGKNADSPSRYNSMKNACDVKWWSGQAPVELMCKTHHPGDGKVIFDACNKLLFDAKQLPYDIDGLIFTPRDLAVFGYYPGTAVKISENVKWDRVLKWKPSEQNTIDFLIREESNEIKQDPITKKYYKRFKLFTGYNASQWEPITPLEGTRLRYDRQYAKQQELRTSESGSYRAKQFNPVSYGEPGVGVAEVHVNDMGACICQDGTPVDSNTIVEFAYAKDLIDVPVSRRWVPLRTREDKTRIFQTGELSKTANDLTVATSIWRAIHNPVDRDHITGVVTTPTAELSGSLEERLLGVDDVYYAREMHRSHMLSVHMLDFHNQGIKKMLYEKSKNREALLELACGKAGDMPRWSDGGYRFVMGVDLSRDNIVNSFDGAYSRMLKQKKALSQAKSRSHDELERVKYMDSVFIVGDCALPLVNGEAAGEDEDSKMLLIILYTNNPPRKAPEYATKYLTGRALKGFNMVSCMFAIHYFFHSETKLDGFLKNVSNNLKQGGIFITTFMDGMKVNELLSQDNAPNGFVEGRKLNGEVPVWAIVKRYNTFSEEECWGRHVDVFLENTNQLIPEFLVHFSKLQAKALEHGLELVEDGMFGDTFNSIKSKMNPDPRKQEYVDKAVLMLDKDEVQKQFSFLNRWAVFKKI